MMNYRFTSLICLSIHLLFWFHAANGYAQTLHSQQQVLTTQFEAAAFRCDFKTQLDLVRRLQALNARYSDEPSTISQENDSFVISEEHDSFVIEDLQKAVGFSEQELELAKARQAARSAALEFYRQGEPEKGRLKLLEAIEHSTKLFGARTYHTLELQFALANQSLISNSHLDEALQLAHQVAETLEQDQHQKCFLYFRINHTLYALHLKKKEFDKAIPYGKTAIREMEAIHLVKDTGYLMLQSSMATVMNMEKRPDLAIMHAKNGLNTGYIPGGYDVKYYLMLLQEYARAKRALGDFDRVPEAYQEMLRVAKLFPNYPNSQYLDHLREYQTALKEMGNEAGAGELESEIQDRLRR